MFPESFCAKHQVPKIKDWIDMRKLPLRGCNSCGVARTLVDE